MKLIIFDLDGTLLNTIEDLGAAVNCAMQQHGLPTHTTEEYELMVGKGVRNLVKNALPEGLKETPVLDDCLRTFFESYAENLDVHTQPYPGIPELLRELDAAGVMMAVASNKFQAGTERLVSKFFPDIRFVGVHGNMEGFPLKPNPALIDLILKEAGTEVDAVMVGDSGIDIQTAKNSGLRSVAVSWGFRPREELLGADVIVDDIKQLRAALN